MHTEVEERQWCELGHHAAEEVQPCRLRGRMLMGCKKCSAQFTRTKLQYGKEQYKSFWQLYTDVPRPAGSDDNRRKFILITKDQKLALHLRAAGHKIWRCRDEDHS